MNDEDLNVYLRGSHIGTLTATRKGASFHYDEEIIQRFKGSPLLSTALLVQEDAFSNTQTANWFSGLLPEDARLSELQRYFGVREGDYLSMLREVGWECAGAVSITSQGTNCFELEKLPTLRLSLQELAERLSSLPSHPFDEPHTMRVSLGGFQEKLCITLAQPLVIEGGYASLDSAELPLDGAATTHILKPQPDRFEGMIEGEAWAMTAASFASPTAKVALLALEDAPLTLIVERFDRKIIDGSLCRIHQEDCAQALGLGPNQKYAAGRSPMKNDPSYQGIAALVERYSNDPKKELEALLRQVVVNLVLGNTDAHAKNYAFLHSDSATIEIAPLYDVVPALEITPSVLHMGMRIDGRIRIDRISKENILREATSWGLTKKSVASVLDNLWEQLRLGITQADSLYPLAAKRHSQAALKRLGSLFR